MTLAATVVLPAGTLRWARERVAATDEDASSRCQTEPQVVVAWESGQIDPPLAALRALGGLYEVPLSAFLLSDPPDDPPPPVDRRTFTGGGGAPLSLDASKALRRAVSMQASLRDVTQPDRGVLTPDGERTDATASGWARLERRRLGVTIEAQTGWHDDWTAFREWRAALERKGLYVLQAPMPRDEVRAFALRGAPPVVVINRSDRIRARIFSLLHEYCHVLSDAGGICQPSATRREFGGNAAERFCNRFAGEFLVPGDALRQDSVASDIGSGVIPPEDVAVDRIARRFHVSRGVVWYRLHSIGFVPTDVFEERWDEWGDWHPATGAGGGGSTRPQNVVRDYGARLPTDLLASADRGEISTTDVAQYLNTRPEALAELKALATERLGR